MEVTELGTPLKQVLVEQEVTGRAVATERGEEAGMMPREERVVPGGKELWRP
jgi:hypothetical protein